MVLLRTLSIIWLIVRRGLLLSLPVTHRSRCYRWLWGWLESSKHHSKSFPKRLRELLQELGPIPVKFGQILSTRPDIIGTEWSRELSFLQDRVPPFDGKMAIQQVEKQLKAPINRHFQQFDEHAINSASIAQVHFAQLISGESVAVKILRPNITQYIDRDLQVLRFLAKWFHRLWAGGRLLRIPEVIEEFGRHLYLEIDLMFEAANAAELKRNFEESATMMVPRVYFDLCTSTVMVSERITGIPINDVTALHTAGIDLKTLSRHGTEIFFTQVFRDGFFHADMHPGNVFVLADGRYCAVDFGIMGTLSSSDKMYLAQNFLAFFNRDYRKVAIAHVEAGWAPRHTDIEAFTGAIRAACEPIFAKPLKEISFGRLLMRLFQVSRHFGVEEQPQLVMLQKTLFNIEGLGRNLDPDLDLWEIAKPYLEQWMHDQLGWNAFWRKMSEEGPYWPTILPELPRRLHHHLSLQVKQLEALEQAHTGYKKPKKYALHMGIISLLLIFLLGLLFGISLGLNVTYWL